MVDDLTFSLSCCRSLHYECSAVNCEAFETLRRTAWPILRNPDREWSETARGISKRLWDLMRDLAETPRPWEGSLAECLGFHGTPFHEIVYERLGEELGDSARELDRVWDACVTAMIGSPLRSLVTDTILDLHEDERDFRILSTNKQKPYYESILQELGIVAQDLFSTPAALKRQQSFSCLITCGPFRENDFVFTAPRYDTVWNVRYDSDSDLAGFPEYLTLRRRSDDEGPFPRDFPVNVIPSKEVRDVTVSIPQPQGLDRDEVYEWSYDEFEKIFLPRNRRYGRWSRQQGLESRGATDDKLDSTTYSFCKLTFYDESSLLLAFDQQSKPPLLLSIDPEGEPEVVKRRPSSPDADESDDQIRPGMLVVLEPGATETLSKKATEQRTMQIVHLPRWKNLLQDKLRELNKSALTEALRNTTLPNEYPNIENTVRFWSKYEEGGAAQAPQSQESFRQLVGEFVGYTSWQAAWDEVQALRGMRRGVGINRESKIEKYLAKSVDKNLEEQLGSSRFEIDVKGFDTPVLVLEVASIEFLRESEIDGQHVDQLLEPVESESK